MKKPLLYSFFTTAALLFVCGSQKAYAENVVQFTGGNYVFAENGRLTFNLEPDLFKNRNWKYNPATGGIETSFTTRALDFKTRYSSTFHAYENVAAAPVQVPFVRPVLTRRQMQQYGARPVFLPALAGLVVRMAGRILVQSLPPVVMACLKNVQCRTVIGVTAAHCTINSVIGLIKTGVSVCDKAEEEGWEKDANGNYVRKGGAFVLEGVRAQGWNVQDMDTLPPQTLRKDLTEEQIKAKMQDFCEAYQQMPNSGEKVRPLQRISVVKTNDASGAPSRVIVSCSYYGESGNEYASATYEFDGKSQEQLQIVDLKDLIVEDIKEKPNDYVNSDTPLGKDLLAVNSAVQSDFYVDAGSGKGSFSVISEPYRTSDGKTYQDRIEIKSPVSDPSAKPSGDSKSGTPGVSVTQNHVSVRQQARPDKEADAKNAENNAANGKRRGKGVGDAQSASGVGNNGNCKDKDNAGTIACAKLGEVSDDGSNPFGSAIGKFDYGDGLKQDNFLPTNGTCPAPKTVVLMGRSYTFSYEWFCEYARLIRAIVVAAAAIAAGFIVFGGRKS